MFNNHLANAAAMLGMGSSMQNAANQAALDAQMQTALGNIYAQSNIIQTQQGQPMSPVTFEEQIELIRKQAEVQIAEVEYKRRQSKVPTKAEMEKYPAVAEAWKEFQTIRDLTLGSK